MNKRRILALTGVILLVLLNLAALVFSLLPAPWARSALQASLVLAVAVPIVLYAFYMALKIRDRNRMQPEEEPEEAPTSPDADKT